MRREQRRAQRPVRLKANYPRRSAIEPDLLPVLSFAGGYGGMVVADDGMATLAGCIREDRLRPLIARAIPASAPATWFEAILRLRMRSASPRRWQGACAGRSLASSSGRSVPGCGSAQGDGIFRVGNAAGEAHPIVGEGISMALQSAFVLAALLVPETGGGWSNPARRPTRRDSCCVEYEARWRQRFAQRLHVAATFAHLAMRPWAACVRRGRWCALWPGPPTHGARWSGKTRLRSPRRRSSSPKASAPPGARGRVWRLTFSLPFAARSASPASAGRKVRAPAPGAGRRSACRTPSSC